MNTINLNNKIVLITGGTGSLGSTLVNVLLGNKKLKEIRIYSRDEYKQSEMARHIKDKRVTYWLGDVRDLNRLKESCVNVDIIIHTAAFKRMDSVSHNSYELSDVNIRGTHNIMIAGKDCEKVIFVSSDKAFQPSCVYGATKMVAESTVLSCKNGIVWRFGNFINSRGSVFEIFQDQKEKGVPLTITDPLATRFFMTTMQASNYILSNVKHGLHFPKDLLSMTIKDLADNMCPGHPQTIIGLREGEKMHESFSETYTSEKI